MKKFVFAYTVSHQNDSRADRNLCVFREVSRSQLDPFVAALLIGEQGCLHIGVDKSTAVCFSLPH